MSIERTTDYTDKTGNIAILIHSVISPREADELKISANNVGVQLELSKAVSQNGKALSQDHARSFLPFQRKYKIDSDQFVTHTTKLKSLINSYLEKFGFIIELDNDLRYTHYEDNGYVPIHQDDYTGIRHEGQMTVLIYLNNFESLRCCTSRSTFYFDY